MSLADSSLLAVDLGLRTGLAWYDASGRLLGYRSKNYGSRPRLKRGAYTLLNDFPSLSHLVVEGGGDLAAAWLHEAERRTVCTRQISAEVWRERLLLPRERQGTVAAKILADGLARRVIDWSDAPRPTSLRHDAAEAILIGLWGVLDFGFLPQLPPGWRS